MDFCLLPILKTQWRIRLLAAMIKKKGLKKNEIEWVPGGTYSSLLKTQHYAKKQKGLWEEKKTIKKFIQLSRAELTQFPGGLFFLAWHREGSFHMTAAFLHKV